MEVAGKTGGIGSSLNREGGGDRIKVVKGWTEETEG
jgi:hypothetical protein